MAISYFFTFATILHPAFSAAFITLKNEPVMEIVSALITTNGVSVKALFFVASAMMMASRLSSGI